MSADDAAFLTSRKSNSVPLSPTKNWPFVVPKRQAASDLAFWITSISALLAAFDRPWLSGIAANLEEVSTTDFKVKAPPAFSKKMRSPAKGHLSTNANFSLISFNKSGVK